MCEIHDVLKGAGIVKFINSLRLRWCGHTEGMSNERMPNSDCQNGSKEEKWKTTEQMDW